MYTPDLTWVWCKHTRIEPLRIAITIPAALLSGAKCTIYIPAAVSLVFNVALF